MIRKKNLQKKKELRRRLSLIITLIILCLMLLFFLSYTIRNAIICNNIKTGNLMQYVGEFEVQKARRTHITIYFVSLGNRDVIRINPNLLNPHCDLTQFSELRFTYSAPEFGFTRAYTCVQVANLDNSESYLDMDISYDEATGCVYLGVVLSALLIVILIVLIMPIPKKLFKSKRQKKTD